MARQALEGLRKSMEEKTDAKKDSGKAALRNARNRSGAARSPGSSTGRRDSREHPVTRSGSALASTVTIPRGR